MIHQSLSQAIAIFEDRLRVPLQKLATARKLAAQAEAELLRFIQRESPNTKLARQQKKSAKQMGVVYKADVSDGKPDASDQVLHVVLAGPVKLKDIAKETGFTASKVKALLVQLRDQKQIKATGKGPASKWVKR